MLPLMQKRTEEMVRAATRELQRALHSTSFEEKNAIFRGILESKATRVPWDRLLALAVGGEVLAGELADGVYEVSGRAGRNQMDGLELVIAGAAKAFLVHPGIDTLVNLGGIGVQGNPAGARFSGQ